MRINSVGGFDLHFVLIRDIRLDISAIFQIYQPNLYIYISVVNQNPINEN
jgi:hypothetical protein